MAEDSDSGEKTEDPSLHRIEEFRKRGEVASSKELTSVLVLSASVLTLALSLVYIFEVLSEFMEWLYNLKVAMAYTEKSFRTISYKTGMTAIKCVAPIFSAVLCTGIISNIAQVGFLFSTEVLTLKFDRINPIGGIKKLFSMRSIVEAIKAVFKFLFILSIVYFFLKDDLTGYIGYLQMDFVSSFLHGKSVLVKLSFSIIVGMVVIAIGDFAYQKMAYKKKLMQTKEQAKKESKEQDGNPEVKQKIRAIQREMSQKRMMADIPTADAVVTNPTHISVVIKYDPETMISPEVVAKGTDHLAIRIREIAKEHNIPIIENVPLARALNKTVKVGSPVSRSLYKAVAEILAFVYKLKRKKKALR